MPNLNGQHVSMIFEYLRQLLRPYGGANGYRVDLKILRDLTPRNRRLKPTEIDNKKQDP